ncbi:MAG: class I SAM-dependent methyltransferase [Chloroflexi bacterium]|nr:class I SAM-dependent methyltransferase [Chloroflexota bacterium]
MFELGAFLYGVMTAQPTWRSSCARLARYFPDDTRRVLDLGCGPGVSTIILAQANPTATLVGLDLAPRMLDEAKHYTARAGLTPRIDYVLADAARLPFANCAFDMVTGHSFLYLVNDRPAVVAESYRVLRSGGRIATMEPRAGAKIGALLPRWREVRYVISVLLWRPYSRLHGQLSSAAFERLLGAAGFRNITTEIAQDGFGLIGSGEKP